ncbi:MAG: FAD-binding protein, partial [Dehalococcoidia bacterium]|nr:FAD-binding protein [Dehalococcoidia bacterium]
MKQADVVIIGAGMGGLTAALAFQKAGIPVRVYEQAPVLSEVGAGIMITPNASAALAAVGAYERVKALSLFPSCQRFRHYQTGEVMT